MNIEFIVFITLLVLSLGSTSVKQSDKCTSCSQMKSEGDCKLFGGCTWTQATKYTSGQCLEVQKASENVAISFCTTLKEPQNTCAKQYGCAYLNGKCTHFSGCSAYSKTSTSECQSISINCVSDGLTCIDAQYCSQYSQAQCELLPNIKSRKCKWDSTATVCREYSCSEAETLLTTDTACDAFSGGCITTGQGCVLPPLPLCSKYTGTDTTCLLMIGSDGNCELEVGKTNCKAKVCINAPITLKSDADCNKYQVGCITTGKGCIGTLGLCSTYTVTNPIADCLGYKGTDGLCEGDSGSTICRARRCENFQGNTDALCNTFKQGCVTNGKTCLIARLPCSEYKGTTTTCLGYLGSDGNCKGTQTTTDAQCAPKDCVIDGLNTYTTDLDCQKNIQSYCLTTGAGCTKILQQCSTYAYTSVDGQECNSRIGSDGMCKAGTQGTCATLLCADAPNTLSTNTDCNNFLKGCLTTGAGCVKILQSCSTYTYTSTDGQECNSRIGLEGNCKAGTEGTCTVRQCMDAPDSFTTTADCDNYFKGCVTTGAGCIQQTTCPNTIKQISCESTKSCIWDGLCLSNSTCSNYTTQSLCQTYQAANHPCIWGESGCRDIQCVDLIGSNYSTDSACRSDLAGCITNGTGCIQATQCGQFTGNKTECRGLKIHCTNTSNSVSSTTPCIDRRCDDPVMYSTDSDCSKYLPGCLTKGIGCISDTAQCSSYTGTQSQCANFTGYLSSSSRAKCWNPNQVSGACTLRQCNYAIGMTSNSGCTNFLSGCLFDGNNSCVDSTASCNSYKYTSDSSICQSFMGVNGTVKCYQGESNSCKDRVCTDNTTATSDTDCNTFLTGCVTTGTGCSITGSTSVSNSCSSKPCANKTDANSTDDCLTYNKQCRLIQGSTTCMDVPTECTGFTFASNATLLQKSSYCKLVTTKNTHKCDYDENTPNSCVVPKCQAFSNSSDCSQLNTCTWNEDASVCFTFGTCDSYVIPASITTDADKLTFCNKMYTSSYRICSFNTSSSNVNCKEITECGEVFWIGDVIQLNDYFGAGNCQGSNNSYTTTKPNCTDYSLEAILEADKGTFCSALKSNNNGVVRNCMRSTDNALTNCIQKTCSSILAPTSQADCDAQQSGCTYATNKCYERKSCDQWDLSSLNLNNDNSRIYCQSMIDQNGKYCSYTDGTTTCSVGVTNCTDYPSVGITQYEKLYYCLARIQANGTLCQYLDDSNQAATCGIAVCSMADDDRQCSLFFKNFECFGYNYNCYTTQQQCSDYSSSYQSFQQSTDKSAYCSNRYDISGNYCKLNSQEDACEQTKSTCQDWNGLTTTADNTALCEAIKDMKGNNCTYSRGSSACRILLKCELKAAKSQADCDVIQTGCIYTYGYCHLVQDDCSQYKAMSAVSTDEYEKSKYCTSMKRSSGESCTSIRLMSTYCINRQACALYDISTILPISDKKQACGGVRSTDTFGCIYWGGVCLALGDCSTYTNGNAGTIDADCQEMINPTGKYCLGSGTSCFSPANCEAIANPTSQTVCSKYLSNCKFYQNKCYTISSTCQYQTPGTGALAFCANFQDSNGNPCTAASDTASICSQKTCSDPKPANFVYSSASCSSFLNTCKSDGAQCIDNKLQCSQQTSDSQDCTASLDSDAITPCLGPAKLTQCTSNKTATTDEACNTFLAGCVTKGTGCVSKTAPCTSYSGTTSECNKFVGNYKQCTKPSGCRARTCSEKTDAASQEDCLSYGSTCRLPQNGGTCIDAPSACTGFTLDNSGWDVKSIYCNSVATITGEYCAYDQNTPSTCVARICSLWVSELSSCPGYASSCKLNNVLIVCYFPNTCDQYIIPNSLTADSEKLQFCNEMQSTANKFCSYSSGTNCKDLQGCEDASGSSGAQCNSIVGNGTCQYFPQKCYTTQSACINYSLSTIGDTDKASYCSALKAYNNGVVQKCKYDASTPGNCVDALAPDSCFAITGAKSQAGCDAKRSGCTFSYSTGLCSTEGSCSTYLIPDYMSGDNNFIVFCQNMVDKYGHYCTFIIGASACSDGNAECSSFNSLPGGGESDFCVSARRTNGSVCIYDTQFSLSSCTNPSGDAICTAIISDYGSDNLCDTRTTPGQCYYDSGTKKCQPKKAACTEYNYTGTTADEKATYCQVLKDLSGNYCSWISTNLTCETAKNSCSDWNDLTAITDKFAFCSSRIDKTGATCIFNKGATACRQLLKCEDAGSVDSQVDCELASPGCTYDNGRCHLTNSNCNTFFAIGGVDSNKFKFCNSWKNSSNGACTFILQESQCTNQGACDSYDVSHLTDDATKRTACKQMPSSSQSGCTYFSGNKCQTIAACSTYIGGNASTIAADCALQKDEKGVFCSGIGTSCSPRSCSDPQPSNFVYSNSNCNGYLNSCKSDGTKCIDISITCAQLQSSDTQSCSQSWNSDKSFCSDSSSQPNCIDKTCDLNTVAITDTDCQTFLTGCLTKGIGCIATTEPCSSYTGTNSVCQSFIGNGIKCWGNSATISGSCRNRTCTDNITATTDAQCDLFFTNCLTNGGGCIDKQQPCSAYKGAQSTCNNFTGDNKTTLCSNTLSATATTACKNRQCGDLQGTTNAECQIFMPFPEGSTTQCLSNGTSCALSSSGQQSSTVCSGFQGTVDTCPEYSATDGPCKPTSQSVSTPVTCTPRICSEAPLTFKTDEQCQDYHPNCFTTGAGCSNVKQVDDCSNMQFNTCSASNRCLWINQCKTNTNFCSELTVYGQSTCITRVLINGNRCAWGNNTCRNFTCADYNATFTSHDQCHKVDTTCTTTGRGCTKLGLCSSYTSYNVCEAANTTEASIRCTWDSNSNECRQRKCRDFNGTTDDQCNQFLRGCKTQGATCIEPSHDCSVFSDSQHCIQDSSLNPCLYVNGVCYNYSSCYDANQSTLAGCQAFNSYCVPSSNSCIPMTSCDKYTEKESCIIGLNNTTCGWSPSGKCQVFNFCSDAAGTTYQECQIYNSRCASNGKMCIEIGKCSSYQTNNACSNMGTDGYCIWDLESSNCRTKQCADYKGKTDSECAGFLVANGICTTDGTQCRIRQKCESYSTEVTCTVDSDGIPCIFAFPIDYSTRQIKSCRNKECSDITGTANQQCQNKISGTKCVSNGWQCIKKDLCANYTNKISCDAGGLDGVCAFTSAMKANPQVGTCEAFSSCEKANNIEALCNSNPSCIYVSVNSGAKIKYYCQSKTCSNAAQGANCSSFPSFDGLKQTICSIDNGICKETDPVVLPSTLCFIGSHYSYTWNEASMKCESCVSTNRSDNITNNNTSQTVGNDILEVVFSLQILWLIAF